MAKSKRPESAGAVVHKIVTGHTLEVIKSKLDQEDFYIPSYQRKNVWEPKRKSKFIESLLIGLPIPFLFFWENSEGKLEVVDGAQRLNTIREFINNELKLSELEKLPSAKGLKFHDLEQSRQRKFKNISIRSIMLTEKADDEARFDLFERINTTSKLLKPAELRRGLLNGPFYEMVECLTRNENFNELAPLTRKAIDLGDREEMISRFFAYSDGLDEYNNSVSKHVFNYVKKMNKIFTENRKLREEYENRFTSVIDFYKEKYPIGFKAPQKAVSKTRFESMTIGAYLAFKKDNTLSENITRTDCKSFFTSREFNNAVTTDASNTKSKLINRIKITEAYFLSKSKNKV